MFRWTPQPRLRPVGGVGRLATKRSGTQGSGEAWGLRGVCTRENKGVSGQRGRLTQALGCG